MKDGTRLVLAVNRAFQMLALGPFPGPGRVSNALAAAITLPALRSGSPRIPRIEMSDFDRLRLETAFERFSCGLVQQSSSFLWRTIPLCMQCPRLPCAPELSSHDRFLPKYRNVRKAGFPLS